MSAISTLTSRAICLRNGLLKIDGTTKNVIKQYLEISKAEVGIYTKDPLPQIPSITRVEAIASEGNGVHMHGEQLEIELNINMPVYLQSMSLSIQIINEKETPVVYTYLFDVDQPVLRQVGINKVKCIIPICRLYQGIYYLKIHLAESKGRTLFETIDKICSFEVQMLGKSIEWGWQKDVCIYTEDFRWEIK